jgi:hypothetical protein
MAFDAKDFGIAAGGALAFLVGWRRLAGVIWGIGGIYEYGKGRKLAGSAAIAGGTSFLLFPDWPGSLVSAFRGSGSSSAPQLPAAQQVQIAPYQKVSFPSLDMTLGGGWTLLDVRDIRTPDVAKRAQALKPGDVASIVLQNKGGPFMVFNARVISGGNGILYAGQWATQPPAGGPQMPEWGPEHVYAIH